MEENQALKLLQILRRNAKGEPLTDAQVRKLPTANHPDLAPSPQKRGIEYGKVK